ncbi:hypothetical protein [Streptomyces sp. NPDC056464]|uniref:hypothetical protein n=1 Tax=Streptomyces sp. NPDC056464 TaxID=3345828 RepID=UPI003681BE88
MSEIAKGVLGGAWTLLVGWILPTALNLAVFLLAVAPSLRDITLLERLRGASGLTASLVLVTAALLLGLVANACQNALYRLLEGYLLWPARAFEAGCRRSQRRKNFIADRLTVLRLERRENEQGPLGAEDAQRLTQLVSNPGLARAAVRDRRRSAAQRALLRELLARFPISDDQIAPTRLGNAIRRFEEYGWDRYRLDTQLLWNELTGCAPDQVRRQSELARVSVDFFVALLFGHVAVGAAATLTLLGNRPDKLVLLSTRGGKCVDPLPTSMQRVPPTTTLVATTTSVSLIEDLCTMRCVSSPQICTRCLLISRQFPKTKCWASGQSTTMTSSHTPEACGIYSVSPRT